MVTCENFTSCLQLRLPNISLDWEIAPDFYQSNKSCRLIAVDNRDANNRFAIDFDRGLGEEPLDDLVESIADEILTRLISTS